MPASRRSSAYDAVVVGSGPNGLAAAIELARAGRSVLVIEAAEAVGGGTRSQELTLPGFVHDVCSAVHPLALASPFFRSLPLAAHGLEWVHSPAPLAHPFDDGGAALLERSLEATALSLEEDGPAYRSLMGPIVRRWEELATFALAPPRLPRHPLAVGRFGLRALGSASSLVRSRFRRDATRALMAGSAAHSMLPLERRPSAAIALVLGAAAHTEGWPVARGGSASIARALAAHLGELGGEIRTGHRVRSLDELPTARAVLLDLTPRQVLAVAGGRLPARYRRGLESFRYGPAAFKVDWSLSGPVPWRAPACARAATVHLGGGLDEISAAEAEVAGGGHPERPFVLFVQPTLFDPTRAPAGRHTAWAYCHVPEGSDVPMTARIEAQVERFAPGFRDLVLERSVMAPADLEAHNPNLVGGHINGGVQDLRQLFFRPVRRLDPYATPVEGLFICSSSAPPGGGVHGMCGYHAARSALRRGF